jgi:hypothetical protein
MRSVVVVADILCRMRKRSSLHSHTTTHTHTHVRTHTHLLHTLHTLVQGKMNGNIADLSHYLNDKFGSTLAVAVVTSYIVSAVLHLFSGTVSQLVSKTYAKLSPADKDRWNSGINRSTVGFVLAGHGVRAWLDGIPDDDIAHGQNDFLVHTAATALGFFIFEIRDSLNMYLAHNIREDILLWHHCMGVILYLTTLYTRSYLFLANVVLIQECTAVFTHIGWMISKSKKDCHWSWIVNQYILIAVWAIFRNCHDFFIVWRYILVSTIYPPHSFLHGAWFPMAIVFFGSLVLSFILNPWWLYRKFVQIHYRNYRCSRRSRNPTECTPEDTTSTLSVQDTAEPGDKPSTRHRRRQPSET